MKRETFYSELLRRLKLDEISYDFREFAELHYKYVARELDAMTGGKLFAGVEQIAEDWKWPA